MNLSEQEARPHTPFYLQTTESDRARFWAKVDKTPGHGPWGNCWLWTSNAQGIGYGLFKWQRNNILAHVMSYRMVQGEVPLGLEVNHMCHTRGCVNPDHLEAITHIENVRKGLTHNAVKTHCSKGHEFSPANTRVRTIRGKFYKRVCAECEKPAKHRYYLAARERLENLSRFPLPSIGDGGP